MDAQRWALALVLVCPTCAGSFFLAMAGAAGVGALTFRSVLLAVAAATLLGLWGWNWFRRRNECRIPAPSAIDRAP